MRPGRAHLESVSTDGVDELRRLGDLASHHERAGDDSAAFAALLQGADLAEKLGAPREAADLLARAADLWEVGADAADVVGHSLLLERAGYACDWAGRARDGYRLLRSARDLVSPERDPLLASRLMVRLATSGWFFGESQAASLADMERAVELSRAAPDSREHAEALAGHADFLFWNGRTDEARRLVEDAVAAADLSGSAAAVSEAHRVRALLWLDTDLRRAELDSTTCWEQAMASGEPYAIGDAHFNRMNLLAAKGDLPRLQEHARATYEWFRPRGVTVLPSGALAEVLLSGGRPRGGRGHRARRSSGYRRRQ